MNFDPTPEQSEFLDRIRGVLAEAVAPNAEAWDREAHVPAEALRALGAAGALGVYLPKSEGGRGLDTVAYALVIEEIASVLPALAIVVSVQNSLVANPLFRFGSAEQKRTWLEPLAAGRTSAAFAWTEAEAGSDATRLATRARRENAGWVLDGRKEMVTHGGPADFFLVVAATDPGKTSRGLTVFLVPGDAPGLARGPREETMGLRSSDVRSLTLEGVRLSDEHRLGGENHGMAVVLEGLNAGRIGVGAQAVGIARGAYERALAWSLRRRQFGVPLHRIPAVQHMLADMATEIAAARLTVLHAAQARDAGLPFAADASRAKLQASVASERATSLAIQVHGGWGYMTATGVERFHRDAKVTQLYEGTSEMQRIVLAGSLTRG